MKLPQRREYPLQDFGVNPEFPFLGCSPDGLVGNDTVVEIKALKIFEQYSVETVTCKYSSVPKNILGRQCFKLKDGKCVLKHTHAYYYQFQHILLVTRRKYCDFLLHAVSGPDSVKRTPRDEPLIKKIFCFLTAFWMLVIALLPLRSFKCVFLGISCHLF